MIVISGKKVKLLKCYEKFQLQELSMLQCLNTRKFKDSEGQVEADGLLSFRSC